MLYSTHEAMIEFDYDARDGDALTAFFKPTVEIEVKFDAIWRRCACDVEDGCSEEASEVIDIDIEQIVVWSKTTGDYTETKVPLDRLTPDQKRILHEYLTEIANDSGAEIIDTND